MRQPELLDVIELLVDLPEATLQAGDQGTIVEIYSDRAYEVEFANAEGETLALQVLEPEQFIVIWQSSTKTWVPLGNRIVALLQTLLSPENNPMNAEELDRKFDDGEDNILEHFDLSTLKRPGLEPQRIEISVPQWMVAALDREAEQLGIQRDAIIKLWLAERLNAI